jgi:cysteinyl-tRNA synthetase
MAMRYLGPQFDIHTGGIDNVFPHHEDEIAQSAPIVGGPPAQTWVHGEFLLMDGRKMAKSAGNFQRVTELADRGIDPLALRYLALTSRYSRKLEYSDRSIEAAAAALASLRSRLAGLDPPPADGPWAAPPVLRAGTAGDRPNGIAHGVAGHGTSHADQFVVTDRAASPGAPLSTDGRAFHDRFVAAIDDDLDMPVALALLREILRARIPADERRWLILDADLVLGLDLDRVWAAAGTSASQVPAISAEAATLLATRDAARAAKDYTRADALRDELAGMGWDVIDGADGSRLTRREVDASG